MKRGNAVTLRGVDVRALPDQRLDVSPLAAHSGVGDRHGASITVNHGNAKRESYQ
jgi:hypothetical protein